MLNLTIFTLVVAHIINVGYSTRLPLEVYELTPNTAGGNDLKHKNLEYSTINGQTSSSSSSLLTMTTHPGPLHAIGSISHGELLHSHEETELKILSSKETSDETTMASTTNQLDRRRSRQMLEIMQKNHHDQQTGNHKLSTPAQGSTAGGGSGSVVVGSGGGGGSSGGSGSGSGGVYGHRDHAAGATSSSSSSSSAHRSVKDVRILYQVGNSEDDLPICAPNAVCSKIDLYETPWIERQCRCPSVNRSPEIVIHHHHKDSGSSASSSHGNHNSEKYHTFYEHSKLLHQQNKHLLLDASSFASDKKYESLHLKKLMHKLGAVYEDDLNMPSDYVMHEETNSALGSADDAILYGEEFANGNEFPSHVAMKHQHLYSNSPHMRHSGHMGHGERISYIGGCPSGLGAEDGHTIADKTRHYKLCQPVHRLPVCRHFRDFTWTLTTSAEMNTTEQIVHCRCPKNSVTYLTKREPLDEGNSGGYKYLFACSPLTRLRCQRKQPCKLFTVRKRQEFIDEVNINALCQCPKGHHCPSHHTQSGVLAGETFLEDNIQTYSGYCMAND